MGDDESIEGFCDQSSDDDFETMGEKKEDCPKYIAKELSELHTVLCTLDVLSDAPEDPAEVDKTLIDDKVDHYFEQLTVDSEDITETTRLFKKVVLSKKWKGGKSPSLSKMAIFGGGALIA